MYDRRSLLPCLPLIAMLAACSSSSLAPTISVATPQLLSSPTEAQLAAYYCPTVITNEALAATCTAVLGPAPSMSQLAFTFGVNLTISNPNDVPVPALDVLLALSLFSGQAAQGLGSTCVAMCGSDDPNCTGTAPAGACSSSQPNINQFASGVPDLIDSINSGDVGDALAESIIPAGGDINLNLAFNLGVNAALNVIKTTASMFVEPLLEQQTASLNIPISVQGALFVNLPAGGRTGVNFGPVQTTWTIN